MADGDRDLLVAQFCKVTGIEAERAKLYLEASGWNSDLAMSTYYEERDDMDNLAPEDSPSDFVQPTLPSSSSSRAAGFPVGGAVLAGIGMTPRRPNSIMSLWRELSGNIILNVGRNLEAGWHTLYKEQQGSSRENW